MPIVFSIQTAISLSLILAGALFATWILKFFHGKFIAFLKRIQRSAATGGGLDARLGTISAVIMSAGYSIIFIIAGVMALQELNFDPTPILASAGVVGLAISFGSQTLIKDIFAGLFILIEDQYREGDKVKLDETEGIVEKLTLRKTVLVDAKKVRHHVPNGQIKIVSVSSR